MLNPNDKHLTVETLLLDDKYIIPFYQRNYAWTNDEVTQLLEDIQQANKKGGQFYYLGTLVVAEDENKSNNVFEVVDGQQRHTTLSIIHGVLQQFEEAKNQAKRNLYFDARAQNERLLDDIFAIKKGEKITKTDGSISFLTAMRTVEQFLNKMNEAERNKFKIAFYKKTAVFRVSLPKGTNLNHYFEIMNNRGEQLEKHEILKAAFMEKIKNPKQQLTFAKIWDACSVMNGYVIKYLDVEKRIALLGENYWKIPTLEQIKNFDFDKKETSISNLEEHKKIQDIISKHNLKKSFSQEKEDDKNEEFVSIIDFPNFLLQVLKLQRADTSLDDKNLLKSFGYPGNLPDSMDFIHQLLNYRILFDNYVIKRDVRENPWKWTLKQFERKKNDKNYSIDYYNSVKRRGERKRLIMLQSMFHVTFTSKINKRWLFRYLEIIKAEGNKVLSGESVFQELRQYAVSEYHNLNKTDLFVLGTSTPRFLFNYVDFLLWELYYKEVRNETKDFDNDVLEQKIFIIKDSFRNFKFVQRNSIEHFFPQKRKEDLLGENKQITLDSFGNLCLISGSSNSSLSGDLPFQKKHDSERKNRNESLKQQIMFQYINDKKDWNTTEIINHQDEIIQLINSKTPNS